MTHSSGSASPVRISYGSDVARFHFVPLVATYFRDIMLEMAKL